MDIGNEQIASKRKVGKTKDGKLVMQITTKGGLHLMVVKKDKGIDIIGSGSHPGVARYIAEKKEPGVLWTELSKSNDLDVRAMAAVLPYWIEVTNAFRSRQG